MTFQKLEHLLEGGVFDEKSLKRFGQTHEEFEATLG
jgi:hypothetical protein